MDITFKWNHTLWGPGFLRFIHVVACIRPSFFFFFFNLFLAALGLCCCVQAFSSCGERGLLFAVVHWLLTAVASPVAELGL